MTLTLPFSTRFVTITMRPLHSCQTIRHMSWIVHLLQPARSTLTTLTTGHSNLAKGRIANLSPLWLQMDSSNPDLNLIDSSFDQQESVSKMASPSAWPSLHSTVISPTHRHTHRHADHATCNILCTVCRPWTSKPTSLMTKVVQLASSATQSETESQADWTEINSSTIYNIWCKYI